MDRRCPAGNEPHWAPIPIFVHAEPCTPYAGHDEVPGVVRHNALVLSARR